MVENILRVIEILTIKEASEAVGISKTSIYNLLKNKNIQTFKRNGKTYIDEHGINVIKAYYSTEQHETLTDIITDTNTPNQETLNQFQDDFQTLKEVENARIITLLENEREEKNKIIQALIQSNQILSQALAADRVNETAKLLIQNNSPPVSGEPMDATAKPPPWYKRIFQNKNG